MKNPEILLKHLNGIKSDIVYMLQAHKAQLEEYRDTPNADPMTVSNMVLRVEAMEQQVADRILLAFDIMQDRINED